MRRFLSAWFLAAALLAACSGGFNGTSAADTPVGPGLDAVDASPGDATDADGVARDLPGASDPTPADTAPADVPVVADVPAEAVAADPGPSADPGPTDPGPADVAPVDPGPTDPGKPDVAPVDTHPADPGTAVDTLVDDGFQLPDTSGLSPSAAACVDVIDDVCAKMLTKCDVLHLIPQSMMDSCTSFLIGNTAIVMGACGQLDNLQSTDPTVQLIQSMGLPALQQCDDNFKCDINAATALYNFGSKFITGGGTPKAADILNLVVSMCFPQSP